MPTKPINLEQHRVNKRVGELVDAGLPVYEVLNIIAKECYERNERIKQNDKGPSIRPDNGQDNDSR
jgi:hypothetical protein